MKIETLSDAIQWIDEHDGFLEIDARAQTASIMLRVGTIAAKVKVAAIYRAAECSVRTVEIQLVKLCRELEAACTAD